MDPKEVSLDSEMGRPPFATIFSPFLGPSGKSMFCGALFYLCNRAPGASGGALFGNMTLQPRRCLRNGPGVQQSFKDAAFWYRKAAAQGVAQAQGCLGFLCGEGKGVPRSDAS